MVLNVEDAKMKSQLILYEYLGMVSYWLPRLQTDDHKRSRGILSYQDLDMCKRNLSEFSRRFITVDEAWITHQNEGMVETVDLF